MGTVDVLGRRGRLVSSLLRPRKHRNNSAPARIKPPVAEPIAIPTTAPAESFDEDVAAVAEEVVETVAVAVTMEVDVNIGGRATVGGI